MKRIWPLAAATFISDFGSSLTLAALPVIFLMNGRKDGIGIYNGFDSVGALVGSVWAMAFLDRFRRNKVAAFSDLIRALVLVPLIFSDKISVPLIAVYAVVQAVFGATTTSAIQAWIAEHPMSEHELKKSNSVLEISSQVARATGPLIGVGVISLWSINTVFTVDAVTFLIGAFLVSRLETKIPKRENTTFLAEVRSGFKYALGNRDVLNWVSISAVHGIGFAILNTVYLSILSDQIQASEQLITFYQTAFFVGSLLGGIASLLSKQSPRAGLFSGSIILAFVMAAAIYANHYWVFFALGIVQTFGRMLTVIATRTLVQKASGQAYLGRVMAFRSAAIDVSNIVIYAIVVPLSAVYGRGNFLLVASASFLFSLLLIRRPTTS